LEASPKAQASGGEQSHNDDHASKIYNLPVDDQSLNQVILPSNIFLMAQEMQDRESSGIIQELISNLTGENLYRFDIPTDSDFECQFEDLFINLKRKHGATVIAIKDKSTIINPDLLALIKAGMAIFYTAPKRLSDIHLNVFELQHDRL
jgi:voltage-gated potassium channel